MEFSGVIRQIAWRWPWYVIACAAAFITGLTVTPPLLRVYGLLAFTLLATLVMLKERLPEMLVIPSGLAVWTIAQAPVEVWQQALAFSLLCILIFASQFIWKAVPPTRLWGPAAILSDVLALGGQTLVVLVILLGLSGPSAPEWPSQVGAGALLVLTLLITWFAYTQHVTKVRHWCYYGAGLLFSLTITWELLALFPLLPDDVLMLPPASYLSVVAPFLMRDRVIAGSQRIGQCAAVVGASGLLLPSLIGSFPNGRANIAQLLSLLLLLAESLGLFSLGILARVRLFILGGAGLVVIAAVLELIYATNQENPDVYLAWFALALSGIALLVGATILTLSRHD